MTKVKCKEGILKVERERQIIIYKEAAIRLSADFSTETLQEKKDFQETFKGMEINKLLLYPARQSFKIKSQ